MTNFLVGQEIDVSAFRDGLPSTEEIRILSRGNSICKGTESETVGGVVAPEGRVMQLWVQSYVHCLPVVEP